MATAPTGKHGIEYFKYVIMFNPIDRNPLPIGDIVITDEVMEECLKQSGMSLHTFQPLAVIDKIGFAKHGDEAGDLLLDALQDWIRVQIANGVQFPTPADVLKQLQRDLHDAQQRNTP